MKYSLITFECAILEEIWAALTLKGVAGVKERAAPEGEGLFWNEAAAATERPTLDRREEIGTRRKIEENSLIIVFLNWLREGLEAIVGVL